MAFALLKLYVLPPPVNATADPSNGSVIVTLIAFPAGNASPVVCGGL